MMEACLWPRRIATTVTLLMTVGCCQFSASSSSSSSSNWFGRRLFTNTATGRRRWSIPNSGILTASTSSSPSQPTIDSLQILRGGVDDDDDDDDERYSRQVYTVGARAHGLIRSSTVYLDGPPASGLVYECAKNLALSGVRNLVLVVSDDDDDDDENTSTSNHQRYYHDAALDDLGQTYQRGARSEILGDNNNQDEACISSSIDDQALLLVEYLKRLNPNIVVSSIPRSELLKQQQQQKEEPHDDNETNNKKVLLCIDRPYSTQVQLNKNIAQNQQQQQHCGGSAWGFVAVETAGVFGRIFCDFGGTFRVLDADGETPLVTPLHSIIPTNNSDDDGSSDTIVVRSIDGEKHDVSKGDMIQFQYRNGELSDEHCVVTEVQTPFRFIAKIDDDQTASRNNENHQSLESFIAKINKQATSFRRVKVPLDLTFKPLESAMESATSDENDGGTSLFTPCDLEKSFDATRRSTSLACFQALATFVQTKRRLPTIADKDDFWKLVQSSWTTPESSGDENNRKRFFTAFLLGCAAKFAPLQAVFGAIGAQEALKYITGLYNPVRQFLLYDCDEVLSPVLATTTDTDSITTTSAKKDDALRQAPGLRYILGDKTVDKLQKKRVFVVGAGAIGCEILKNLASMGVATRKKGAVVLTDMDTIEKSNLSRQFLFRDNDIGKFKSIAAQEASLRLNPSMKIEAHSSKVGAVEHSPFDDKFWSKKVDVVLNALDNVEARLYMDGQCVANKKALVDAGTMGSKGNVQVVVPFQSESYASSADPPEPAIPVCTLKNFPYLIAHTIQWGRDLFDGLFQRRPEQANDFLDNRMSSAVPLADLAAIFTREKGDESAMEIAEELGEDLSADTTVADIDIQTTRRAALTWAAELAYKLFFKASADLLQQHPLESVDEDGEPFWSGTRRPPQLLFYNATTHDTDQATINANLVEFVRSAARLRVEVMLGSDCTNEISRMSSDEAKGACVDVFSRTKDKIDSRPNVVEGSTESSVDRVHASLSKVVSGLRRLTPVEFEKDDETNGHVAFVTAASNLRAISYSIPPVDAMETRRVAGNIVPAMITTTAFVSALSCMELVKLVQKAPLRDHRNAFINLALPFFAFTVPLPAEKVAGLQGRRYTIWDQLSIKEGKKAAESGGMTVRSLLKRIKKRACNDPAQVDVASISCGPYMLYANFLHEDDDDLLNAPIWELVNEAILSSESFDTDFSRDGDVSKSQFVTSDTFLDLTVVVEDAETGDEVELPPLRVERFNENLD